MLAKITLPAVLLAAALSGQALAAETGGNAFIPFADLRGSISDWQADGTRTLYVEGQRKQWYKAEFRSPCHSLPFTTAIGFVTDGTNRIDRFGSIVADGERCWFKSFEKVDQPPEES